MHWLRRSRRSGGRPSSSNPLSLGPMALCLRPDSLKTWPSGGNDMGVRSLTKQECLDLLASVPIGRVALTLN